MPAPPTDNDIILERFDAMACTKCKATIDTRRIPPFQLFPCPHCGEQLRMPARFANFILLQMFGKGGMGAVYRAYDQTLGRSVAIKVTQRNIARDRAFVAQFLQEARALAAINHPNIVQIYNYGEQDDQPYIVMELVDGDRLDHIQAKRKILDEEYVLSVARQVIMGLEAASAAGMTHGDIKPANILFDRAGNAKVADFGLARFAGQKPKPGEIWGTPFYVAPEVVRGNAPRAPADIYSLGATMYHLITGEPPFNGKTVTDTVLLRFKEPPPDPRTFKPSLSPRTATLLLRMLEMDAARRHPNYASLLYDVDAALHDLRVAKGKIKSDQPQKSPALPIAIVGGILGLLILGGVAALIVHHLQTQQADKSKREKLEADLREGRLKQVFIGGKLSYVAVKPDAPPTPPPAPTAPSHWNLPPIIDTAISGDGQPAAFRVHTLLPLRAGSNTPIQKASKIYLAFDLSSVNRPSLSSASLRLTASKKGRNRAKAPPYALQIWTLKHPLPWNDTITWASAPANNPSSPGALNPAQALLVTSFPLPPNPEAGDVIEIFDKKLLKTVQNCPGNTLTLILTGDTTTDHHSAWNFAASEDSRFKPPTLSLR